MTLCRIDEVEYLQASHIRVETDEPGVLTPDGEVIGFSPMEVRCLPRAIEVFAELRQERPDNVEITRAMVRALERTGDDREA